MVQSNGAYDWDERVDNPQETGEFVLLEPGKYRFLVLKWDRAKHNGSANLPPCNKAVVHVQVTDDETGASVELKNNLFLHKKCDGLSAQFFTSCGLRNHGEPLDWSKLAEINGCTGWVDIGVREGTGNYAGKQFNEIKRFCDPQTPVPVVDHPQTEEPEIPF